MTDYLRLSKLTIFAIYLFVSSSVFAEGINNVSNVREYKQVKIYFVDWDIKTRVRLSPEDVKRMNHVYMEINDERAVLNIAKVIFKRRFKPNENSPPEEARLVMLVTRSGKMSLFYANRTHLLPGDSSSFTEVTNDFIESLNPF